MKKTIAIVLSLILCIGLLAGCGGTKDDKTITIAASPTPYIGLTLYYVGAKSTD